MSSPKKSPQSPARKFKIAETQLRQCNNAYKALQNKVAYLEHQLKKSNAILEKQLAKNDKLESQVVKLREQYNATKRTSLISSDMLRRETLLKQQARRLQTDLYYKEYTSPPRHRSVSTSAKPKTESPIKRRGSNWSSSSKKSKMLKKK
jgi:hypothetical protein